MPSFRYQTLSGPAADSGATVIDAPDRAAAVRELRRQGITPVKLEAMSTLEARREAKKRDRQAAELMVEGRSGAGIPAPARISGGSSRTMTRLEMATFVREIATAVQAGLPLVPALKTIARQRRSVRQAAMLNRLIHDVEHGKSLADSAAAIGRPFNDLVISLIRAGEASGRLGEILEQAANLLDRDMKLRRTLVAGLIYPAILGVLIAGAIGIMVGFIVPKIIAPFAGKLPASALPFPTRVVVLIGDFVGGWWWAIAIALALGLLTFQSLYRQPASRLSIDRAVLKIPLAGKVLREVAVARFTRTLGTLISSGLPALSALRITRATLGNKAMEAVVEQVCEQVAAGKTIAEPLERSGYFPGLLTQIVGLGERSGRLPQMLNQAASVFEDRTENSLKVFTTTFPVIMVLGAAVIIGFVMAGVLLPLIQMQDMIAK